MNWPGMPASLSRQSLQLFAAEVLPSLRAAGPHGQGVPRPRREWDT
jgi:hypothetical protein